MSARKSLLSATEWMDFYERLFREENSLKVTPRSLSEKGDGKRKGNMKEAAEKDVYKV